MTWRHSVGDETLGWAVTNWLGPFWNLFGVVWKFSEFFFEKHFPQTLKNFQKNFQKISENSPRP